MIKERNKIEIVYKGGGNLISLAPIFSKDGSTLYVAKPYNIISYNVETGNKILEFPRTKSEIIGFNVNVLNDEEHVIACTKNGSIILWKTTTGLKLREIKTNVKKVVYFKTLTTFDDDNNEIINAFICFENESTKKYNFKLTNLDTNESKIIKFNLKIKKKVHIDVANDGSFIAAVQDSKLFYYQININVLRRHFIKDRTFTFVLCHPTENVVLTGDNTGRVVLWQNLLEKNPTQSNYHWHTLPAKTACFSSSGTQFYSGASECVLVKWIVNSNHQSFLPRLPGFIEHISIALNNQFIAVSTSDNAIHIVTPQLKIKNTIQHLVISDELASDLVFDPRSRSLIFNGISGHVQFFSPKNLELIHSMDVSGKNKYTNERDTLIVNLVITNVVLDKTGRWMATVEERKDPVVFESRLKFWFFDETQQNFILNTSIEFPHEGSVKNVAFQPSNDEKELYCVTIGEDLKFKLWEVIPIKTVYREGLIWECAGEMSYRNLTPNVSSFSSDGSLLAIGFESIVTTWLPESCELKCSLRHPIHQNDLCHVSFGADHRQCHLLLTASKNFVCVWNLLTLSMVWSVKIDVHGVISDINCSYKAVFTPDNKLFVFDLNSPDPVYFMEKLKNVSDVAAATFVPKSSVTSDINRWDHRLSIFILTSNFELFAIESSDEDLTVNNLQIKEDHSFFKNILPEIRNVFLKDQGQIHAYSKDLRGKKLQQLLDTPVPSLQLSFVCEDILVDSLVQEDPSLPNRRNPDNIAVEEKRVIDENVNKLIIKNESLTKICDEKMTWTSVLV
nr:WD repeat-containing protein 75 [Onthophagus taurus]